MKAIIYYFTGRGNSLKIVKDLAKKLEVSDLIPIVKVWDMEKLESMRICLKIISYNRN